MSIVVILLPNLLSGLIDMKNAVRKAIRVIIDQLGQLEESSQCNAEKLLIQDARISLVRADYYESYLHPNKKYVEPKSDFILTVMATLIKSSVDGCWYYDQTQWKSIFVSLCNALDSFSEADQNHEIRIILDNCADEVSKLISKSNEC